LFEKITGRFRNLNKEDQSAEYILEIKILQHGLQNRE